MGRHRVTEEKLQRVRLGSRYFGFNLAQFYWECLKLAAALDELTETQILRRILKSWSETLPPAIQEKARAEATCVEAWKAQEQRARRDAKLQAKRAQLSGPRAKSRERSLKDSAAAGTTHKELASLARSGMKLARQTT